MESFIHLIYQSFKQKTIAHTTTPLYKRSLPIIILSQINLKVQDLIKPIYGEFLLKFELQVKRTLFKFNQFSSFFGHKSIDHSNVKPRTCISYNIMNSIRTPKLPEINK
jgi:hypothetical protein